MNNNAIDIALASAGIGTEELTEMIQAKMAYGDLSTYYRQGWIEVPEIAKQEGKPIKTPFGICHSWILALSEGTWVISANSGYTAIISECSELIPPYDKDGNHIEPGDTVQWGTAEGFLVREVRVNEIRSSDFDVYDKSNLSWAWTLENYSEWTKHEVPDTWENILEDLRDVWNSNAKDEIIERMERMLEND